MTSIIVSNISPEVTQQQISDFFSFCGKISSINLRDASSAETATKLQEARIVFENETAAKTALLLTDTKLDNSNVVVQPDISAPAETSESASSAAAATAEEENDIQQEYKPKAAIIAEIISHGYVLSDKAVLMSAEFDKQHGISSRFQKFLSDIDTKYNITNRAATTASSADTKYGITERVNQTRGLFQRYLDLAMGSTTGAKVRQFYADASKEANDIHKEARRLADLRERKPESGVTEQPTGTAQAPIAEDPAKVGTSL
ncbi:hypothetical protein POJ06DRAFT_65695 [Lipomyces tetrasporus]|jgi:hypothetical protein|uniref:RRM domain-containing protein n=1 Tax=Lipomyces tetrasporus TaxID=54092 RepID=A0AAD7VWA4_9ASCO|nr:uncharacterized protein POJ06DRAFT_65695 [Lipomyces tetrasporus]KAJ8103225.1 hypothetical protein POJ06DRAFT_65695 [Lipomyces tetrasporus]